MTTDDPLPQHGSNDRSPRVISKRKRRSLVFYLGVVFVWLLVELGTLWSHQTKATDGYQNDRLAFLPVKHAIWQARVSTPSNQGRTVVERGKNGSQPSAIICAMIKDENRYLEEWSLYHLALGFEEIHIFDNSDTSAAQRWYSDPNQNLIIQKRVRIHSHKTKEKKRQLLAFRTCMKQYGTQHSWVAFFDSDEFLVLKKHENVVDFLSQHCVNGSLGINWLIFGTSNQTDYVDVPVTQRFQYHTGVDSHIKTIVKASDFRGISGVHWVKHDDSRMRHDTSGKWIRGVKLAGVFNPTFHPNGPVNVAALHHYKYRSLEEFNFKGCHRGYAFNQKRCFNHTLDELPPGHIFDDTAWKLLQKSVPKYRKNPEG